MARRVKEIDLGYRPRAVQQWIHQNMRRFSVGVCHRRMGKTVLSGRHQINRMLNLNREYPRAAYIAPTYKQAKIVAWDYYKRFTKAIPGVQKNESELTLTIPRPEQGDDIKFYLFGSEDPDSIRGIYLDDAVIDEYALCPKSLWGEVIRPLLSDRKGHCRFIGTPKGTNHFSEMYHFAIERMKAGDPEWFAFKFRASDTGIIPQEELDSIKIGMSEAEFQQEYECDFSAANVGAYYAEYLYKMETDIPKRITRVPHDPNLPVSTWWDLGLDDEMAIWFTQTPPNQTEHRIINYMSDAGKGVDYYIKKIMNDFPYTYNYHGLPHDAKQREIGTGVSRQETMRNLGLARADIVPYHHVADGINGVRQILPKCLFDETNCRKGLISLKNYQKMYNQKLGTFENKPRHDWASHAADAFRTFAMGQKRAVGPLERKAMDDPRLNTAESAFDIWR